MEFHRTILPSGLKVITVPLQDNPTATVLVMVAAGSEYEHRDTSGLSHFIEHMCFKGTAKRPKGKDISYELDSIGAHYNAFTSQEFTGYFAKVEAKHAEKVLDVISDIYLNPKFDAADIEREKGVIVEEINMYEDMPHYKVRDLFLELLYGDQPAGWSITGTKESVRRFKREDFCSFVEKFYTAPRTTVVVAGGIDHEEIEREIARQFEKIGEGKTVKKPAVKESQKAPQIKTFYKATDQAHFILGVRTFDLSHPSRYALKVIEGILSGGMSGRLFQKLREEMGVGYYVRASEDTSVDHGIFTVSAGVDTKRIDEALKAIIEELNSLKTDLVSESELKKVKDYIEGITLLGLESSDDIAEFFGIQEVMGREILTPAEAVQRMRAVTAEDVRKVAELVFEDKRLNLAVVGPYKDGKKLKEILSFA